MIRTTFSTTRIARSARCVLVAATMTLTTALIGGMLQGPAAAYAGGGWHKPVRSHVTTLSHHPRSKTLHPTLLYSNHI